MSGCDAARLAPLAPVPTYTLTEQRGRYAVCLLPPASPVPAWAMQGDFWSVTRTADELSVICEQEAVPATVTATREWVLLRVEGPFDFSVTGVLASLTQPLAQAAVPCLAVATHQTDYLLIQTEHHAAARAALIAVGHRYRAA